MKNIIAAAIISVIPLSSSAFAAERQVTLSVPGMTCASCPFIVKGAISKLEGIVDVQTDLEALTATVLFEDTLVTIDDIMSSTADVGYQSSIKEPI